MKKEIGETELRKNKSKKMKQETSKTNLREKRGITLVALVITVIIIIILATVAISFAFGDNGLINRAEDARDMYANDTAYTEGSIANVESYINGILDGTGVGGGGGETPVEKSEVEIAKDSGEKFKDTTPIKDDSGDTLYVPGDFGIASDSATDIDDGVVITDGTNEFVWIPVSDADLADMYSTTDPDSAVDTALAKSSIGEATTNTKLYSKLRVSELDQSYYTAGAPGVTTNSAIVREPDILVDTGSGDASTDANEGINLIKSELGYEGDNATVLKNFAQGMVDEYRAIFDSIKQYDGFYIGRYELTGTANEPTVQRYQPVLTAETSGANTWYGLKDACSKVVNSKYAKSHMIYGNQWDEVMDWLVDTGDKESDEVNVNSSSWGNYSNSSGAAAVEGYGEPQESGYSDEWSANNIYDLAGNYLDWTQEANFTDDRVLRGR